MEAGGEEIISEGGREQGERRTRERQVGRDGERRTAAGEQDSHPSFTS